LEARSRTLLLSLRALMLAYWRRGLVLSRRFTQSSALMTAARSQQSTYVMSPVVSVQSIDVISRCAFAQSMSDALTFVICAATQRLCVWTHHPPWGAGWELRIPDRNLRRLNNLAESGSQIASGGLQRGTH
jgi:hypothetical protein